jgi:hypothetical protein
MRGTSGQVRLNWSSRPLADPHKGRLSSYLLGEGVPLSALDPGERLGIMEPFNSIWPVSDVPSHCISIYDGADVFLHDFALADVVHRTVFAAYWPHAEILNGGLLQFFRNGTGVLAPEAVAAYKLLGLPLLAAKLQDAMDWFGCPYPRERELRQARLDSMAASYENDPFESANDAIVNLIYEEEGGLEAAALAHVRQHVANERLRDGEAPR